jgi:hypothetical protein
VFGVTADEGDGTQEQAVRRELRVTRAGAEDDGCRALVAQREVIVAAKGRVDVAGDDGEPGDVVSMLIKRTSRSVSPNVSRILLAMRWVAVPLATATRLPRRSATVWMDESDGTAT